MDGEAKDMVGWPACPPDVSKKKGRSPAGRLDGSGAALFFRGKMYLAFLNLTGRYINGIGIVFDIFSLLWVVFSLLWVVLFPIKAG